MLKRILLMMLCASIVLFGETTVKAEGLMGNNSPEEVITNFIQAISEKNLENAIQCFAVDEMAEGYNHVEFTERVGCFMPKALLPSNNATYIEMNRISLRNDVRNYILRMYLCFILGEEKANDHFNRILLVEDLDCTLEEYANSLDPYNIESIEVISVDYAQREYQKKESVQNDSKERANCYGADEYGEYCALIEQSGEYWILGFDVLNYHGEWLIQKMGTNLTDTGNFDGIMHLDSIDEYYLYL